MEIAHAIAYLHSGFRRPIIFRSIDPHTIVFNEQYVAKLFDFSHSIAIPEEKCNEKVDVYSFGIILLVLFTGFKATESSSWITVTCLNCNLEHVVKIYIEQDKFTKIVDPIVVGMGLSPEKEEQLQAFAELAFKCVSDSAEDRPTMIDFSFWFAFAIRDLYSPVPSSSSIHDLGSPSSFSFSLQVFTLQVFNLFNHRDLLLFNNLFRLQSSPPPFAISFNFQLQPSSLQPLQSSLVCYSASSLPWLVYYITVVILFCNAFDDV
ncbi:hypothetical protein Pint_19840 [Pistacia integerrima]|uniref:Uncharacterized protein n=1 Tax=Pistacia integerrima TaxID=434235 RepID=A0ACC0XB41_9ROSI|nr:hypothetical protein Pint_19840 [Pistacia integerrima]